MFKIISKLPIRQVTVKTEEHKKALISKLPIRQVTGGPLAAGFRHNF